METTVASCCAGKKSQPACCSAVAAEACCPVEPPPTDTPSEPVSRSGVTLRSMLACGGIVAQWLSIGGAPPPPVVVAVASITPRAEAILSGDVVFSCVRAAPDAPPPRVA
mgnify:FL=1